jgi:hypothetical protein
VVAGLVVLCEDDGEVEVEVEVEADVEVEFEEPGVAVELDNELLNPPENGLLEFDSEGVEIIGDDS